jgi:hypothetical protein
MGSRHGRATFSVLLFQVGVTARWLGRQRTLECRPLAGHQRDAAPRPPLLPLYHHSPTHPTHPPTPPTPHPQDLAVVVLLMLIPLLAPDPSGASGGAAKIAQALGLAAVKVPGGRGLLKRRAAAR